MHLGLDFGTTNSAIARANGPNADAFGAAGGAVRLATIGDASTFRTVLYFDPHEQIGGRPAVLAGPFAIERYLSGDGTGRWIQSIKSHLASRLFDKTMVFGRTFTLPELVALFLDRLLRAAESDLGALDRRRVVVGRPVRYAGSESPADDDLAIERMREGLALVGIEDPIFEPEPLAAAFSYERTLDHDELVLVADFGGGTSDFCLLRLGPRRRGVSEVLAIDGVGIAGDAFDGEIVTHAVAPALGLGSRYRRRLPTGEDTLEVPTWIYGKLRRWHHLSFLKSRDTLDLLDDLRKQALEPEKLRRLIDIVENDLGFHMYRAVEGSKVRLSRADVTELTFEDIATRITRDDFNAWIEDPLTSIGAALDRTLQKANVTARDVDAVFMTGGTSLVPAVHQLFAKRFGENKLRGGDELVSVALGLALRATIV
jgi:hypothetical chaperone protein